MAREQLQQTSPEDRRRRVQRLKKTIVGIVAAGLVIPLMCCVYLICRLHTINGILDDLNRRLDELEAGNQRLQTELQLLQEEAQTTGQTSQIPQEESVQGSADPVTDAHSGQEQIHKVYLTFDDGPIPEVTPWVLELLKKHDIKATFFMVGDNIRKHPDEYRMVVEHGHRIGNHTFNHIRGFEYSNPDYLANTRRVDEIIHSDLFRPPHGHMGFRQYYTLRHHYRIIMWDLVTRDYSKRMRPEQVLNNVKRYVRNGSIITFHDSLKSWNNGNLQYALPRAIEFLKAEGYEFKVF